MVIVSPVVYYLWVGDAVQIPILVSALIGFYVILQSIANMHSSILNGMGIIKMQIIQAFFQVALFVLLIIFLYRIMDLYLILIILLSTSVVPALILPMQVKKLLNKKANGIWNK